MIETEAQVLQVENEYAWVRVRPHAPCGHCDPEAGCKSVALTRLFGGAQEFRVRNPIHAQPGDLVLVVMDDGMLLKSALWGYGLPLALLMAGAALGSFFAPDGRSIGLPCLGPWWAHHWRFCCSGKGVQNKLSRKSRENSIQRSRSFPPAKTNPSNSGVGCSLNMWRKFGWPALDAYRAYFR